MAEEKKKRQVFYSFHFKNDVFRVQQIRNIGVIEDNKPVSENKWEEIKKSGDDAIKKWINENIDYRSCVVVLVGEETANRIWVKYEIIKAWNDRKGLVGIYIHNLKDPNTGKSNKGANPFGQFTLKDSNKLSSIVKCYNPSPDDAYNNIKENLEDWIDEAINIRNNY